MAPFILEKLQEKFQEAATWYEEETTTAPGIRYLTVPKEQLHQVCFFLHTEPALYFDHLACLTGIDNPEKKTIEIVYNLYSVTKRLKIDLRVVLERTAEELPSLPSVSDIWGAAEWHEREAYDLLGVRFEGHPDLRRILLPEDWEGYPLRKDYQEQEKYHGLTVKYDRDNDQA